MLSARTRRIGAVLLALVVAVGVVFALRPSANAAKGSNSRPESSAVDVFPGSGKVAETTAGPESPGSTRRASRSTRATRTSAQESNRSDPRLRRIGFRTERKLRDHYTKHGHEFGNISLAQYLSMAQDLRDAPLSKRIIETVQTDGTISRFDRTRGSFLAFDRDLTIRTFFRPDDGEDYFWRAAKRRR